MKLGRVIARKSREDKAKVKLDEMVDNYLKPFVTPETKEDEKTQPEPVVGETQAEAPVNKKKLPNTRRKGRRLDLPVHTLHLNCRTRVRKARQAATQRTRKI